MPCVSILTFMALGISACVQLQDLLGHCNHTHSFFFLDALCFYSISCEIQQLIFFDTKKRFMQTNWVRDKVSIYPPCSQLAHTGEP